MFDHIVVPLDLSQRNTQALATARALAERLDARVTLLHVVQKLARVSVGEMRAFYRRLTAKSRRRLNRAAREFAEAGIPVRVEVCIGDPAHEIVRRTRGRRADLIVMASHRIDPKQPRGWGTTSYKVGILSQCAILLVK
ncbi:MAG TPA: universal stress protein [Methylomirabilota bacterium]|jgi:nucleotide-binding universal stress UspA family protein